MFKCKVIRCLNYTEFEELVNDFCKDKLLVDIKYSSYPIAVSDSKVNCVDSAMIVYKEGSDE